MHAMLHEQRDITPHPILSATLPSSQEFAITSAAARAALTQGDVLLSLHRLLLISAKGMEQHSSKGANAYVALLLGVTLLERSLGDLLAAACQKLGTQPPANGLLKDVISSPELEGELGSSAVKARSPLES